MSRSALALVFPAALVLLVCTLVVLFLTATGLEPGPAWTSGPPATEPTAVDSLNAPAGLAAQPLDSAALAAAALGEDLFKSNCAQCHSINDVVVGPALAGIGQRRSLPWLVKWVQNPAKVVASGDEYAVKIFNQYQKQQMPSFNLSEEEIKHILAYVRAYEGAGRDGAPAVAAN